MKNCEAFLNTIKINNREKIYINLTNIKRAYNFRVQ